MQIIRFNVEAKLQWLISRGKSGCWVGSCDPLSLTVEADTFPDLQTEIGGAIDDLFRYLLKHGELGAFLVGLGWTPEGALPPQEPVEGVRFDVPWDTRTTLGPSLRAVG